MRALTIRVLGTPRPKGSAKAFVPMAWATQALAAGRAPRAIVTGDNNRNVKDWQHAIRAEAQIAMDRAPLFTGPVRVSIVFELQRPKTLARRIVHHTKKPDIDKLSRAVLDGMTGVCIPTDAIVVELVARKVYAGEELPTGATILIEELLAPEPSIEGGLFEC
jgi:crossover junction endodeoxyribonuclease RusA